MVQERDPIQNQDSVWIQAHDFLKHSMKKEIGIMREVLANMHEEEISLLMHDKEGWNQVMSKRSELVEHLRKLRLERIEATNEIEAFISEDSHLKSFEDLILAKEVDCCEIFCLRDQMMALLEKMNKQNIRNEHLFLQLGSALGKSLQIFENQYLELSETSARRRIHLALCEEKRDHK